MTAPESSCSSSIQTRCRFIRANKAGGRLVDPNLNVPPLAVLEGTDKMLNKLKFTSLALVLAAGATVMTAPAAEARRGYRAGGVIAGTIIGLGVLGAYAHARERDRHYYSRSCYPGRQRCDVVGQRCWYNRYGEYVCKDDVRCYRPTICD